MKYRNYFHFIDLEIYFIYTNYVETKTLQERGKKMLKTNLEILDFIKFRLESAKKAADNSMNAFMEEDFSNHETISRNLSNYLNQYSIQLAMESLINFIESDVK